MTCEEAKLVLADYWNRSLADDQRLETEAHWESCEACRRDGQWFKTLWDGLALLPDHEPDLQPGPELRERFYQTLSAYREGAAAGRRPFWIGQTSGKLWGQIAAGFVLLLAGMGLGYGWRSMQAASGVELAQLRGEVSSMRQLVALSLLQQQSASERLRGVSWAYQVEPSNSEVLSALLAAVNHDPNVNVRLAAVDALHPFAASPVTRNAVIQALPQQNSPIVQVALIDLVVDLRVTQAARELEQIARDPSAEAGVRERAQWALEKIQ